MQTTQVWAPLGGEGEEVIKRRDAVDPAGRQLEPVRDVDQDVVLEVAEKLLRGVQHLDQGVGLEPLPLHARVEHLEPVVAAGVGGSSERFSERGILAMGDSRPSGCTATPCVGAAGILVYCDDTPRFSPSSLIQIRC